MFNSDIKLILFDLDNTLYNFNEKWDIGTYHTFKASKLTDGIQFEDFIVEYKKNDKYYWELHHKGEIDLDAVRRLRFIKTLQFFGKKANVGESDEYFQAFISKVLDLIKPDETVNRFLKELSNHYKIGILTNGKVKEQSIKINNLELDTIIPESHIFVSEKIGYDKPNEKAFLTVLNDFKLEPREVIYVGDSWDNDVIGAKKVGIKPIWIDINSSKITDHEIDTYSNIHDFIKHWNQVLQS
ncbi:HAD family hydrolase [Alkalihalobacillus trypoxylicola]|uniref:Haloacid dehalogenase n=1 Tax=Alkalihalobacillus trypoxylicola TaxID=519424 RepID=A0A161P524_9BACI|nr:HAD family hydrolase [Alkalihalobacillus trypoxylicola]KYG27035.1 hypothetical protein AZF04_11925 [Alkalihalobacillus trypoxylicola]